LRRKRCGFAGLVILAFSLTALVARSAPAGQSTSASLDRAFLDQYCIACHNDRSKTAGLSLETIDLKHVSRDAAIWEKVARKLRGGLMPPQGRPRPDEGAKNTFVSLLEAEIDRAATPHPGRSSLHRLNRTEYGNAIRDALDLKIDVTDLLPADDESDGFDNIADVLRISPSLLEQYLVAARKISALAVGDPATIPVTQVYRNPPDLPQDDHIEGLPLGTRGGILIRHNFPLDAEYDVNVVLLRNVLGYLTGLEWPHQLEVTIDGERVFLAPVGGVEDNRLSDANFATAAEALDERLKLRVAVKAGPHMIGATFLRKNSSESDEPLQPHTRDHDLQNMNGIPRIDHVNISGPFKATGSGNTPSRRRIFACAPENENDEAACAKRILTRLARMAYRQTPSNDDVETLLRFYQRGRSKGNFEAGIQSALEWMLAAPKFIFRAEPDPANVRPGQIYRISDLELASRLSFFLWSTIPDDELLTLAEQGKLSNPATLEAQVRRMLGDSRSQALVDNFAGQWLFLRNLQSARPDGKTFPNFDDTLRQAFRRETELFFASIMREDRPALDFLTADYTFVNERLARHYGIPNVYGSHFRRVTVTNEARRGLLGQGSILTVTSYPNRTSPVLRGKWILENILGTPPPAPPANVPPLKENDEGTRTPKSVRELVEEHRKNPACATCHAVMDPLGFSLENFDATGEWRVKDFSGPIDASGVLANGRKVDGPITLRKAIEEQPEQFVRTLTEKLLVYGLGRGLEYYDMPAVRGIVHESSASNYRFSSLILNIVKSASFQMKAAPEQASVASR
jgi:cytochrome c551/c552